MTRGVEYSAEITLIMIGYVRLLYALICLVLVTLSFTAGIIWWQNRKSLRRIAWRYNCYYKLGFFQSELCRRPPESGFSVVDTINHQTEFSSWFSASLYGNNAKYRLGAEKVAETIFRRWRAAGWQMHLYLHDRCATEDGEFIDRMTQRWQVCIHLVCDPLVKPGNSSGMFWRFMPLAEPQIRFIVIDVDEDINDKYVNAILHKMSISAAKRRNIDDATLPLVRLVLDVHYPWPNMHITGKWWGCDNRHHHHTHTTTTPPINAHTIQQFPVRSPFGADEIFLTHIINRCPRYHIESVYSSTLGKLTHAMSSAKSSLVITAANECNVDNFINALVKYK
jgi:hypothetical protein